MSRKTAKLFCVGAALALALTVPAFAVNENCAEKLDDLGLFRGTQAGFDLERAPTRAEAATMLVRLLGAEQEVQSLAYTAPFTDLQGWEKPYVQYLYQHNLTNGTSETAFSPKKPCSAQMYAAFLLRALGYTEAGGDFSYANAVDVARARGIYDVEIDTQDFLREDVTEGSFTALSVSPKGADGTLLDRLVAQGAVDAAAATETQTLFAQYAAYRAATTGMDEMRHFSVLSAPLRSVQFHEGDANGAVFLTVGAQEETIFNLPAGAMRTDRTVTLSAPGIADRTQASQIELDPGVLSRRLNGVWVQNEVSDAERALRLRAYGRMPLAFVSAVGQDAPTSWRFDCEAVPPIYDELLWPYTSAVGPLGERPLELSVSVTHSTRNGRITAQRITVDCQRQDRVYGQVVIDSRLDRVSETSLLAAYPETAE